MNERDIVLLGGGHAHVLAIRAFAMNPPPATRITLISEHSLTPYSGMLPGYVAGHYRFDETHIDLNRLCQRCNVRWIHARATGLDLERRQVMLDNAAPLAFDWLSVDTGSRPDTGTPGAAEHAVGVKPVSGFAERWQSLLDEVALPGSDALDVGVVGGGAGGTELVLAIAHRLREVSRVRCHIVYPDSSPLPGYPERVVCAVSDAFDRYGIASHPESRVERVGELGVETVTGSHIALDHTLWCTAATAPDWPRDAGLQTDERGFITVDRTLRSVSHPFVFAAGDIAHMPFDPRPKAGVYAVRQAPWLTENLRRMAQQKKLKHMRLQRQFLSLLSLGGRRAVGTRHGLSVEANWVWRWKDSIDRAFMRRVYNAGGTMAQARTESSDTMHCAGCASKLGPAVVRGNLSELTLHDNPAVTPALGVSEDAATWRPTAGLDAVQSLDGFRAFTQDDYRFGQITTNHALSDIYAMAGKPVSAMLWTGLAFNHPRLQARDHRRMLAGVTAALNAQQCVLAGGHSSEGAEAHIALAVTGEVDAATRRTKNGAQSGDQLLLTKPLGIGVILAANQTGDAPASAVDAAFDVMHQDNSRAAEALVGATALTDVTGFGVLGHLIEMLDDTDLVADVQPNALPAVDGALGLLQAGFRSSLHPALEPLLAHTSGNTSPELAALVIDPQTSGGLLACVPADSADQLLTDYPEWRCIGTLRSRRDDELSARVRFLSGDSE